MNNLQKKLFSVIPADWMIIPFPDVVFFQEGPGLLSRQFTTADDGVPFLNIRCIKKDGTVDKNLAQYVNHKDAEKKYKHFMLEANDYVLSMSGTIGRLAKVQEEDLPLMLNTSVIRFRSFDEQRLDSYYLRHLLLSDLFYDQISNESQGSAQVNVGPTHLKKCYAALPPLPEQEKIAEVLSTVDEKLDNIEQEIEQTKTLKKGLMQKLLAGQLSVTGIPHSFNDSKLGPIPEDWVAVKLGSCTSKIGSGVTPRGGSEAYVNSGLKQCALK